MTGLDFLSRAHELHPQASRVLTFEWVFAERPRPCVPAWTLGLLDDWILKPLEPGDEHFHQGVSAFLQVGSSSPTARAGPGGRPALLPALPRDP